MTASRDRPLAGRVVVTTREHAGELDRELASLGATVVHVPLIEVADPDDGGAALRRALADLGRFDRVVVTSPNGARCVGAAVRDAAVATAAVGAATASTLSALTGRPVDLVPTRQLALGLLEAFDAHVPTPERILVAQADRAAVTLVDGLRERGHDVTVVTAYRTIARRPGADELRDAVHADAIVFVSGSAAASWAEALADVVPPDPGPLVCVIGPSTDAVARDAGLKVHVVAADHSVDGVVAALAAALAPSA